MVTWEQLYDLLGVREFIYFISSPSIQDQLFGVKLVFIFFAVFFFLRRYLFLLKQQLFALPVFTRRDRIFFLAGLRAD